HPHVQPTMCHVHPPIHLRECRRRRGIRTSNRTQATATKVTSRKPTAKPQFACPNRNHTIKSHVSLPTTKSHGDDAGGEVATGRGGTRDRAASRACSVASRSSWEITAPYSDATRETTSYCSGAGRISTIRARSAR